MTSRSRAACVSLTIVVCTLFVASCGRKQGGTDQPGGGKGLRKVLPHAHFLASLSGKDECAIHI